MLQPEPPPTAGWPATLAVVLAFALLGAWGAVELQSHRREQERHTQLQNALTDMARALEARTVRSEALEVVALMGREAPLLQQALQKTGADPDPAVLALLGTALEQLRARSVEVYGAQGQNLALATAEPGGARGNAAQQPWFQAALLGRSNVHAAVDGVSNERVLYLAAPLHEGASPTAPVRGVVAAKLPFALVDAVLAGTPAPALLLSPQGVVVASTRAEWLFALAPPLEQRRIDALAQQHQFGRHFANGVASALPFDVRQNEALIDGGRYAIGQRSIDWNAADGRWSLVLLDDLAQAFPWADRMGLGLAAGALCALLGLLAAQSLRNRQRMAASRKHLQVLGAALHSSPMAVAVTDPQGQITWVNPAFERTTGYTLAEVQGLKTSLLASGQTPLQTYSGMWAHLVSGRSWEGQFINRRKDGSTYHAEASISPVLDERGRCIGIVGLHQDVSERMREQQALQHNEARLRELLEQQQALFDNAPPVLLTGDGNMRLFNPAFTALVGGSARELHGKPVSCLFASEEAYATFAARVAPQLAQGQSVREHWTVRRLDGSPFEARVSASPVHLEGCARSAIWIIEDVTDVLAAERAMQQARERLELAQEAGKIGVFDVDLRTGTSVWSSKQAGAEGVQERIFDDWRAAWAQRLYVADREAALARMDAALAGTDTAFRDTWRQMHSDGRVSWFECSARIFRNAQGQAERLVGVNVDIDAYKQLETRAAAQLQFQQVLIDTIPLPVVYKDSAGRYLGFNRAYEQAFGIRREDYLGKTVQDMPFFSVPERSQFQDDVAVALQGDAPVHREVDVQYADGQVRRTLYWLQGFGREGDALSGVIGTLVDISEREHLAQDLRRAKELAEEAAALKAHFLANMSHEIRTPMNAIIGMSHLALKSGLTPRQHDYVSKIEHAGQHLMGVINDILDFSRIEAGKLRIDAHPFVLDQVLTGVVDVVSHKASAKGLELICDVDSRVPQNLVGDALRIGQILINFANNAVKFTEQGDVGIVVRVQDGGGAGDGTGDDGDRVVLRMEVRDTGIGLAPEQMERLFQSFQQADASTTRRYGGTGLGLAICKSLAELMQGEVGVHSTLGRGSTFWVTLPLRRGAPTKPLLPAPELQGLRVLVVDDNANAAMVLSEMLRSMRFAVDVVHSGAEALAALRDAAQTGQAYGLVVLDWQMPGMDGLELGQRIGDLALPALPHRVMVTAYGREDVLHRAHLQGIEEVLIKPVSASVMFDTLMQVLGHPHLVPLAPVTEATASCPQLPGARLLVAEDNELNQQVALELLRETGAQVDLARNGEEAVRMVSSQPYDLVFMDMQMPVLDGLEATRRLRALPGLARLPIVAMTANAMEADRQRCLEAGMSDHLAKPVVPERLWEVLQRWCPAGAGAVPVSATSGRGVEEAGPTPAVVLPEPFAGLDAKAGLRNALGRPAFYAQVLQRFMAHHADSAERMASALAEGHTETLLREAHTLRGLAGTIGALPLQEAAAQLEEGLREPLGRSRTVGDGLQDVRVALAAVMDHLQRWALAHPVVAAQAGAAQGDPSQGGGEAALQALADLLHTDDPRARQHAQRHEAALRQLLGTAQATLLAAHIEQFDFETALHILTGWLARHPQAGAPDGAGDPPGGRHAAREPS